MRNKRNVQEALGQIEAIQQSFIQFARNTPMIDSERVFMDRQIELSAKAFEQIRTFLNQEDEEHNTSFRTNQNYGINSGRF
jgi:hypothetical protein